MSQILKPTSIEKICKACDTKFIPTIHKEHQKYCKTCQPIVDRIRHKKNYQKNKTQHSSVVLSKENALFLKENGISISKFVNQKLDEIRSRMKCVT